MEVEGATEAPVVAEAEPAAAELLAERSPYSLALQAKRHVLQHGAVVETGVVLKYHAAVGARPHHGTSADKYVA